MTANSLPEPPKSAPKPPCPPPEPDPEHRGAQADQALLRFREPICDACDAHGGACELVFPQVKGCKSREHYRPGHLAWLATPTSRCPRGKWAAKPAKPYPDGASP